MATVKFTLNRGLEITDSKSFYPIYVRYRNGRKCDFTRSLKVSVRPENWNESKEEVKEKKGSSDAVQINNRIRAVKRYFEDYTRSLIESGTTPTTKEAKDAFKAWNNPIKQQTHNLFTFFEKYIDDSKNKESTKKAHRTTLRFLERFNQEVRPIDFEDMDFTFYDDFMKFCDETEQGTNTRGKHIKTLKTVLNHAVKHKLITNTEFRGFKVDKEEVYNVYLTPDELRALEALELPEGSTDIRVRDLFLIGAWTGLRVSDFNRLNEYNITEKNGIRFIDIKTEKTGKRVVIPIHPVVERVLQRHGNKPPLRVAEQTINRKLKGLCMDAGIDETIQIDISGKGYNKVMKCDLVKTHTARRSFATNAYLARTFDTFEIMSITGHTTQQNFLNYIKADELEKAQRLASNPFFTETELKKV